MRCNPIPPSKILFSISSQISFDFILLSVFFNHPIFSFLFHLKQLNYHVISVILHLVEQMPNVMVVLAHVLTITLETHMKVADPNVFLILIVTETEHALNTNVSIHVLELVVMMQLVKLLIIFQFVHALKDLPEIHSQIVGRNRKLIQFHRIHAHHLLVDQTHNVEWSMIMPFVLALLDLWAHHLNADPNVLLVQSVHQIMHVLTKNVLIRASELVAIMLDVK